MKQRILFVCLGNICRSPAADAIMHHLVEKHGMADRFGIDSAGTYGGHAGQLPNPPMREAGTRRGYAMTHRARPVTPEDLDRFDMIIYMDTQNYRALSEMATPEQAGKLYRMTDFCTRFRDRRHVPDPYNMGPEAFEEVLDILEDACEGLLKHLCGKG